MIVEVKQEHIDEGIQGNPCYCAVTLAVRDALEKSYKFSNASNLDLDAVKEDMEEGYSWVETAVQGSGAEISIYTKLERKVVEDIIVIEDESPINSMSAIIVEDWIENFDTFDDSEPISFKVEDIHRMQQ